MTRTVQSDKNAPNLMPKTWSNYSLRKNIKTSEHYNGTVAPSRFFDPKILIREEFVRNKMSNPLQLIIKKYHLIAQYWLSSSEWFFIDLNLIEKKFLKLVYTCVSHITDKFSKEKLTEASKSNNKD